MKNRLLLTGIVAATVVSGGAFLTVLFAASPDSAGLAGKILFFISLDIHLKPFIRFLCNFRDVFKG